MEHGGQLYSVIYHCTKDEMIIKLNGISEEITPLKFSTVPKSIKIVVLLESFVMSDMEPDKYQPFLRSLV